MSCTLVSSQTFVDLAIENMLLPEAVSKNDLQGIVADDSVPLWTSLDVSESEDNESSYWSGDELKIDEIMNLDDTGKFFVPKQASGMFSQTSLPGTSVAQQLSSDQNDSNQLQQKSSEVCTNQAETVRISNPGTQFLTTLQPSLDDASSFSSNANANATVVASAGPPKTHHILDRCLANNSSSRDRDLDQSQSHTAVQGSDARRGRGFGNTSRSSFGDSQNAGGNSNSIGPVLGEREGLQKGNGMTTKKVVEGSGIRGATASSTRRTSRPGNGSKDITEVTDAVSPGPITTTPVSASTSAPSSKPKKIQASLSTFGFHSSPAISARNPSSSSKPSSKSTQSQKSFLGVFVPSVKTLLSSHVRPESSSSSSVNGPSGRSKILGSSSHHDRSHGDGSANIVGALSAAFTSNDHSDYMRRLGDDIPIAATKTSSRVPSSPYNNSHSVSHSHSHSASHSTKPTSIESAGDLLANISSASAPIASYPRKKKPSVSASTNPQSRQQVNPAPILDVDNDSDNNEINLGSTHSPPNARTQSSWPNNTDDSNARVGIAMKRRRTGTLAHTHTSTRTSSSTPDPLTLRTPEKGEGEHASVDDDNEDRDHVEEINVQQPQRRRRGPDTSGSRNTNTKPNFNTHAASSNDNTNSIVNALSNAFGSSIGTPKRIGGRALGRHIARGDRGPRPLTYRNNHDPDQKIASPLAPRARLPVKFAPSRSGVGVGTRTRTKPKPRPASVTTSTTAPNPLADALTRAFADNDVDVAATASSPVIRRRTRARGRVINETGSLHVEEDQDNVEEDGGYASNMDDEMDVDMEIEEIRELSQEEMDMYLEVMVDEVPTVEEVEGILGDDDDKSESESESLEDDDERRKEDETGTKMQTQRYLENEAAVVSVDGAEGAVVENQEREGEEEIIEIETEGAALARLDQERERDLDEIEEIEAREKTFGESKVGVEEETQSQRDKEEEEKKEQLLEQRQKQYQQQQRQRRQKREHLRERIQRKEEERQEQYQLERFQLMTDVLHLGGGEGKWARLIGAQIQSERLREREGEGDPQKPEVELDKQDLEPDRDRDRDPIEASLRQRKLSARYTSDGRSFTEHLFQRVEDWFGEEFLTMKVLGGGGQKPLKGANGRGKKIRRQEPQVGPISTPQNTYPQSNDETAQQTPLDDGDSMYETEPEKATLPPETSSTSTINSRTLTPTAVHQAENRGISGPRYDVEERGGIQGQGPGVDTGVGGDGMKRARDDDDGQVNGNEVSQQDEERPAKRTKKDSEPKPKLGMEVAECPALMSRLLKGKKKTGDEEVEMIEQLLEILAGDDWDKIEQEAMEALLEARDPLWRAIARIANIEPGMLGIAKAKEMRLVGLAKQIERKFAT